MKANGFLVGIIVILTGIVIFLWINPKPSIEIDNKKYDSLQAKYDTLTKYAELVKATMQLQIEAKDILLKNKESEIKVIKSKIKTNEEIRVSANSIPVAAKVDSLTTRFGLR